MNNNLVQTTTKDELILNGLYKSGDKNKPVVILIHGFTSDFYSHKFFHDIQKSLTENELANVAIQTRGTGIRTEFIKNGRRDGVWMGSFYEKLNEAHLDISAWIDFLKEQGYKQFILAGHSLGTIKSVRYLFEGEYADDIKKLILLAPFDKNGYIEKLTEGKWKQYAKMADQKTKEGKGQETIPDGYDDYPMSYQSYASWYEDSELSNIWDFYKGDKYNCTLLNEISIPVQIIVGDSDDFFYIPKFSTIDSTKKILESNISDLELNIVKGAGHTYVGFEDEVAKLVNKFIASK